MEIETENLYNQYIIGEKVNVIPDKIDDWINKYDWSFIKYDPFPFIICKHDSPENWNDTRKRIIIKWNIINHEIRVIHHTLLL